jgi:hypothetical protein
MCQSKTPSGSPLRFSWLLTIFILLPAAIGTTADTVMNPADQLRMLQDKISVMEQQLQRLRDREDIENLISAYGYYLDKALWDQVADLFTADGAIEISRRGVYVGKQRIRESLELYGPQGLQQQHLHNHIQLQPLISIADDGETAWSRHRALSQLGTFGRDGIWSGGIYENEYVKEDGIWKFRSDHIYSTFFSFYEDGFVGGRPAPLPSADLPPDLPATEDYASYPDVYLPAYHFKHPVTGRAIRSNGQ